MSRVKSEKKKKKEIRMEIQTRLIAGGHTLSEAVMQEMLKITM